MRVVDYQRTIEVPFETNKLVEFFNFLGLERSSVFLQKFLNGKGAGKCWDRHTMNARMKSVMKTCAHQREA